MDLRQGLLKAGLISQKDLDEAEASPPRHRRHGGSPKPARPKQKAFVKREFNPPPGPENFKAFARSEALKSSPKGTHRFYFESRHGEAILFLSLDSPCFLQLQEGKARVFEAPSGEAFAIPWDAAEALQRIDPLCIR